MEQNSNSYCPNKDCKEYGLRGQGQYFDYEVGMERERSEYCFIAGHAGSDFHLGWGRHFSGFIYRMR